jgi:hypothetical protein
MQQPFYIGLEEARAALAEIGITLTAKQLKRAADPDAEGRRKLPFFVDPIDHRLKIERNTLLSIYLHCQVQAERDSHVNPAAFQKPVDSGPRLG